MLIMAHMSTNIKQQSCVLAHIADTKGVCLHTPLTLQANLKEALDAVAANPTAAKKQQASAAQQQHRKAAKQAAACDTVFRQA